MNLANEEKKSAKWMQINLNSDYDYKIEAVSAAELRADGSESFLLSTN